MIKSDDFDVRPQFCFVQPRWCLRTYVLSGEKNYLQPCDVYFELYSPVPLPLDALMDGLILTVLSYGKMSDLFWLKMPSMFVSHGNHLRQLVPIPCFRIPADIYEIARFTTHC